MAKGEPSDVDIRLGVNTLTLDNPAVWDSSGFTEVTFSYWIVVGGDDAWRFDLFTPQLLLFLHSYFSSCVPLWLILIPSVSIGILVFNAQETSEKLKYPGKNKALNIYLTLSARHNQLSLPLMHGPVFRSILFHSLSMISLLFYPLSYLTSFDVSHRRSTKPPRKRQF